MPDSARIVAEILCPVCCVPVLRSARFQWGGLPGPDYKVGNLVDWLTTSTGTPTPPFELYSIEGKKAAWNCGAPDIDVVLLDLDVYTGDHTLDCDKCHVNIAAIVVTIKDGRIIEAKAVLN